LSDDIKDLNSKVLDQIEEIDDLRVQVFARDKSIEL
jgi:hypothetical protein